MDPRGDGSRMEASCEGTALEASISSISPRAGRRFQGPVYLQMVPLASTKTELPSATSEEVWLRSNAVEMPALKGCQLFPLSELAYIPHWLPESRFLGWQGIC